MPSVLESSERVSFGAFELFPVARVLNKFGATLPVGSRALDLLIALVERAGDVVNHRELISRAWRGLVVDDSNLRVQITALRKTLGEEGAHYIANIPGQGYSFVAPLQRFAARPRPTSRPPTESERLIAALAAALGVPPEGGDAVAALIDRLTKVSLEHGLTGAHGPVATD